MSAFTKTFSVDSALLKELGERLVTTPHVALAELVKNSYDADATEVRVTIREHADGGPEIEVSDNGNGMTLQQIESYWMRIGNTHKAAERRSPRYGRPLTGNKGIGRFCVRRLGTRVDVESDAATSAGIEHNELGIDWTKFTPGTEVGAVKVTGVSSTKKKGPTGLKLTMSGHPRSDWHPLEDKRSYNYLKRQLATLAANQGVRRRGFPDDPGFRVVLDAPSLEMGHDEAAIVDDGSGEYAIDFREELMSAGWALLTANIDKQGHICSRLEANSPVGNQTHQSGIKLQHLRQASLRLAIFVEESEWNRNEQLVPLGKLNGILNEWGGIQVRHKGMRVFPYGDSGDDWLEIDRDRGRRLGRAPDELSDFVETIRSRATTSFDASRVLLSMLSAKAFLGGVEIDESQEHLEQRADRQGFVDNATFRELRHFARYCVNWAMIWRDFAVKERERQKIERHRLELERFSGKKIPPSEQGASAIRVLSQSIQQFKTDPTTVTPQAIANMRSAVGLLDAELKTTRSDMTRFQLVASAATLSLLYHHEVQFLATSLDALASELAAAVKVMAGKVKERCEQVLSALKSSKESLAALADLTQDMGILDRKAQATSLDLALNTERAVARFKRVCEAYDIEITPRIEPGLLVGPMLKGELAAILLNVISNAIKAVIAGSPSRSLIELHGYRSGKKVCLDVKDNGIGISRDEQKAAFMPLVSDPSARLYDALEERLDRNERQLLGQGSGLGLSIVKGVIERHDGSASFREPEGGWATCLHLEFKPH